MLAPSKEHDDEKWSENGSHRMMSNRKKKKKKVIGAGLDSLILTDVVMVISLFVCFVLLCVYRV
jgi:hypothetical protein